MLSNQLAEGRTGQSGLRNLLSVRLVLGNNSTLVTVTQKENPPSIPLCASSHSWLFQRLNQDNDRYQFSNKALSLNIIIKNINLSWNKRIQADTLLQIFTHLMLTKIKFCCTLAVYKRQNSQCTRWFSKDRAPLGSYLSDLIHFYELFLVWLLCYRL